MALTKSTTARAVQASAANAAGATTTTAGQLINYGVSGVATLTNGATAPTLVCAVFADFSADNVTYVNGPQVGAGDKVISGVTTVRYGFGPGGDGGDWSYYRLRFAGNTGQPVTVAASDSTTTAY